jgi:DNA-binding SARP family transcriptional activator/tetratricopeptide (TPR) repeat protein
MAVQDQRGHAILPRTRKSRAILAILAMASPKPVLRATLAELLWSRRENEQARASLRQCVHELQDTLGADWGHLFQADRYHLSLKGEELVVDVPNATQDPDVTVEALERYGETLLADLDGLDPAFDRWLNDERSRCQRHARTIGESLLGKVDDAREGIAVAKALLGIDRTHEGAWRMMIRGHAMAGDVAAAMDCYDACRTAVSGASGQPLSRETEDLALQLRAQTDGTPDHRTAPPVNSTAQSQPAGKRDHNQLRLLVVPLKPIGEDRDGFAAGLSEEISAGLSRFRWISCVPGAQADGSDAAMLDADMMLEGTVQQSGTRVRIIVKLVDRRAEREIIWAGRFDRTMTDQLSLQDELGAAIVAQIDPELMRHEGKRPSRAGGSEATAQDLLLRALPGIYRLDRGSFLQARKLLDASLAADPSSSLTNGWLGYWNLLYVGQGWAEDPVAATSEAARLAERAVMLDPSDARALTLAGHVRAFLAKRPEEAIALHERAITLNPNMALAWCFSGLSHFYLGEHEEALRRIRQAISLSPSDPHAFFFDMALILPSLMAGDRDGAITAGRRAIEINPLFSSSHKGYLSVLGLAGRTREAKEVLSRLMRLEPEFSVQEAILRSPMTRSEDLARYAEGLRLAGLQEFTLQIQAPIQRVRSAGIALEHSPIDLVAKPTHSPVRHAG